MKKNVVLLHADQLRADALGCMGNVHARTPAIDRLAAGGTVCTRHIVANPVCMPSRASLLTGLYPSAHGVWTNGVALQRREYLPAKYAADAVHPIAVERATMADLLADAGYDTAAFGKLHLTPCLAPDSYGYPETWSRWDDGGLDAWRGPYFGFRHVELTHSHGDEVCARGPYASWLTQRDPGLIERVRANGRSATRPVAGVGDCYASALPGELHHSTWLGERACAYIESERPKDRPFFLWVGFPDPHHPFTPPPELAREFASVPVAEFHDPDGAGYPQGHPARRLLPDSLAAVPLEQRRILVRYTYALVHLIDRAVDRILASLARAGLAESTIIAFTSDHGDYLGDHGLLRKTVLGCDPLARVPFILRAPGSALPARVGAPMSNVDVLPTMLDCAGLAQPSGLHGVPLARILSAPDRHRAFVLCATRRPGVPEPPRSTTAPTGSAGSPSKVSPSSYRHHDDPGEMRDLARSAPAKDLGRRPAPAPSRGSGPRVGAEPRTRRPLVMRPARWPQRRARETGIPGAAARRPSDSDLQPRNASRRCRNARGPRPYPALAEEA